MRKIVVLTFSLMLLAVVGVRAESDDTRGEIKETFKENRLQLKEAEKQNRAEFKAKLEELRDQKKAKLAEKLSNRMCEINKNRTARMTQNLDKMSQVLDKVVARTAEAKTAGKDTSSVDKAVETARKKIDEAKSAVSTQAGKACEVVVTGTDAALKSDVEKARLALEAGLKEVHQKVVDARKSVGDAIRALAVVLGEPVPEAVKE